LFPPGPSAAISTTSVPYSLSRLGIAIGDVSGKGAPAAIYAALVSGILRSHAPIEPGPAEMLSAVNLSLAERRIAAQFVSIIYAVWDDEKRTLLVANSGLPRPIYYHDGKIESSKRPVCPSASLTKPTTTNSVSRPSPAICSCSSATAFPTPQPPRPVVRTRAGGSHRRRLRHQIGGLRGQRNLQGGPEFAAGVDAFDDQTVVAIKVKSGPGKRK
jgi:phosphoserine phosphatase RsbU/P